MMKGHFGRHTRIHAAAGAALIALAMVLHLRYLGALIGYGRGQPHSAASPEAPSPEAPSSAALLAALLAVTVCYGARLIWALWRGRRRSTSPHSNEASRPSSRGRLRIAAGGASLLLCGLYTAQLGLWDRAPLRDVWFLASFGRPLVLLEQLALVTSSCLFMFLEARLSLLNEEGNLPGRRQALRTMFGIFAAVLWLLWVNTVCHFAAGRAVIPAMIFGS